MADEEMPEEDSPEIEPSPGMESEVDGVGEEEEQPRIDEVLKSLPLLNDLYVGMQAMNLTIVDAMIEEMEADLLAEFIHLERTPIPSVMIVSALSQLWIFGVYELLRTWRQRLQDVLKFADRTAALPPEPREAEIAAKEASLRDPTYDLAGHAPHVTAYRRAVLDQPYRESLRTALYRSEIPFRRIESLRVHLAKHEIPKAKGVYGGGAGYSRINYDGSIAYHVPLGDHQVDIITRRQIADDLRQLADDRPLSILSSELQEKITRFAQHSYGIKRVIATLKDGTQHDVAIAWGRHLVFVRGYGMPPFGADMIVDVEEVKPGEEPVFEEPKEG
jgi:hypothetical protein